MARNAAAIPVTAPKARLIFVDFDAPEARADQLLTKMIEAMGVPRDDVYVLRASGGDLSALLEARQPEVIVTLGDAATRALLGTDAPVASLRGRFQAYRSAQLMPTFHPTHLLQIPAAKKEVWDDLQTVAKTLGIKVPTRKS